MRARDLPWKSNSGTLTDEEHEELEDFGRAKMQARMSKAQLLWSLAPLIHAPLLTWYSVALDYERVGSWQGMLRSKARRSL